jgi:Tol biopolymer transport system component
MPDVKEVYEMVTKQKPPEPGALERQWERQRRATRNRKVGVIALVAALLVGLGAFAIIRAPGKNGTPATSNAPSPTGQALSIVDIGTGGTTTFTAPISTSGFDFSLDGSLVTYTDLDADGNDQVFVMDADGSNQRQLTHTSGGVSLAETPPQWSPDGSTIAYWATPPSGVTQLFVVHLADGVSTRVTHESRDVAEGGWASDRSFVFSISNPTSDSGYPLLAKSVDVETGVTTTIARDVSTPEVSPDGTQIAFDAYFHPQGEAWLSLMNSDGTGRRKLQQVGYSAGSLPKWSPDSTQIAFIGDSAKNGSGTYVYDRNTGKTRFVTNGTVESWIDDDHILVS